MIPPKTDILQLIENARHILETCKHAFLRTNVTNIWLYGPYFGVSRVIREDSGCRFV